MNRPHGCFFNASREYLSFLKTQIYSISHICIYSFTVYKTFSLFQLSQIEWVSTVARCNRAEFIWNVFLITTVLRADAVMPCEAVRTVKTGCEALQKMLRIWMLMECQRVAAVAVAAATSPPPKPNYVVHLCQKHTNTKCPRWIHERHFLGKMWTHIQCVGIG